MTSHYIRSVNADVAVDRIRNLNLLPVVSVGADEDALIAAVLADSGTKRRLLAALLKEITDA